ncbi:MAG TPA: DUF2851 family protein [Salinimicrobium sp.]|nr:DUF2851 family protein [Salinimicrobium sp.]
MEEAFLHYLWKYKKFDFTNIQTSKRQEIIIIDVGTHNENSGPDFFNSKIKINNQLWAGNVEIHLKSSFWYSHNHDIDPNYDNVILHVVWEHDAEVFRKNKSVIPVLELKNLVSESSLLQYEELFLKHSSKWINCENHFGSFGNFELQNWLERLYFERLEEKSNFLFQNLEKRENDWEAVLFGMLAKNFGLNLNGDAFLSVANSIPFSVVRKVAKNVSELEALFFGQAQLLEIGIEETYFLKLKNEYEFQKRKYKLDNSAITPMKYFRLRPDNFPSIRLAQLAALYASKEKLFSKIIVAKRVFEIREIFNVEVSEFWNNHYSFKTESPIKPKIISNNLIDLIIINTVIPIKFCFAKHHGKNVEDEIINLISAIKAEKNSVINKFNELRKTTAENALQSQALLQMKKKYCDANLCLRCQLGHSLLH